MPKISVYKYCVANEPEKVLSALRKTGFNQPLDLENPKHQELLAKALRFHVNKTGDTDLIKSVHPDNEFFQSCGGYSNLEGDDVVTPKTTTDESKNIGSDVTSPEKIEAKPEKIFNVSPILIGVGIGIVTIGLLKVIMK